MGTVVETFGTGEAFLVEFNKNGKAAKGECDWMGVLYPTEIELGTGPDKGLMPGARRAERPRKSGDDVSDARDQEPARQAGGGGQDRS